MIAGFGVEDGRVETREMNLSVQSLFILTFILLGKSVKNKFLFTMTAYQKAKKPPAGIKNKLNKNIGQNTHHDKRDNTPHKERPKMTT